MKNRAQGITEYALVIAAVAAALLAMQPYFKRGVQAVVKISADQLGGFDSGITPEEVQRMAINQELDTRYVALQSYEIQTSTEQSVTVTAPLNANGERKTTIKGQDTVKDINPDEGKVFYQELRN